MPIGLGLKGILSERRKNNLINALSFTYSIDRSGVPYDPLRYYDITLKVKVNDATLVQTTASDASEVQVERNGDFSYITTSAPSVTVQVSGVNNQTGLGNYGVSPLKHGKSFAWSHGMDDNQFLANQIALLESFDYRATLFMIASIIDDTRTQAWITDAPEIHRLVQNGWALGNHGWYTMCPGTEEDLTLGQTRLNEIIDNGPTPTIPITALAAPCFESVYHTHLLNLRPTTTLISNESGASGRIYAAPGAVADYTNNGLTAKYFNIDNPIGRDTNIGSGNIATVQSYLDWMSAEADPATGKVFWFNSLTHGNAEDNLSQVINYIYNNYGLGGNNTILVAPSEEIINYFLVRDNSTVTSPDANAL